MENTKHNNYLNIGLVVLSLFVLVGMSWNRFISYDESYTLSLIRHSFKDIIYITALDVHPPLYYLIMKVLTAPFSYHLVAVKLATVLPAIILLCLAKGWFGRIINAKWYAFFLLTIPAAQSYLVAEIRMYGWIALFITITMMAAIEIYKGHIKFYYVFGFSGLCAAYCHYFALVTVVCIYCVLFLFLIFRKNRLAREWLPLFGAAGVSVVCYLPWLFVFMKQLSDVSADYWIPEPTLYTYLSYFLFPIYSKMNIVVGIGLFLIVAVILLYCVWKRKIEINWKYVMAGLAVYVGMIMVGITASIVVRPVFSVRYVKCVLPVVVLLFAYILDGMKDRKCKGIICISMVVFSISNVGTALLDAQYNAGEMDAMVRFARDNIPQDAVVLHLSAGHPMGIVSYELSDYEQLLVGEAWKEEFEAYTPTLHRLTDWEQLEEKDIWIVGDAGEIPVRWNHILFEELDRSECFEFKDGTDWVNISLIRVHIK